MGFFHFNFSQAEEESRALQQSEGLGEEKTTLSRQGWDRDREGAGTGMGQGQGWDRDGDGDRTGMMVMPWEG